MQKPSVGRIVHYVSFGTPGGEYQSQCRAAIITEVLDETTDKGDCVSLCVLNPTGQFFNTHICQDDGMESKGDPNCPQKDSHGNPFRYCPCGWIEKTHKPGTWHWPERVETCTVPGCEATEGLKDAGPLGPRCNEHFLD